MSTDHIPYTDSALFNRWLKGAYPVQKKRNKKEQYTGTRKGFKRMKKARGQAEGENK